MEQTIMFGNRNDKVGVINGILAKLHEKGTETQTHMTHKNGYCTLTFVGTDTDKKEILNYIRNF